jgi:hypothetical protein
MTSTVYIPDVRVVLLLAVVLRFMAPPTAVTPSIMVISAFVRVIVPAGERLIFHEKVPVPSLNRGTRATLPVVLAPGAITIVFVLLPWAASCVFPASRYAFTVRLYVPAATTIPLNAL